jgi:hypothetical protein
MRYLLDVFPLECAIGSALVLALLWITVAPPLEVILYRVSAFWWALAEAVQQFKRRRTELRSEAAEVAR